MKKYLSALVAMCMFLIAVAAHGAPAPATAVSAAPAVSAIEKLLLTRTAKAEAELEKLHAIAGQKADKASLEAYSKACNDKVERQKADKAIRARLENLRKEDKVERGKLLALINEIKGLEDENRKSLVDFVGRLGTLEGVVMGQGEDIKAQAERVTGIEQRQNATDNKVAEVAGKVAEVASKLWTSEFAFGVFTEKGYAMADSGFNARFGMRNASGNGWFTSLCIGAGDLVSDPRPTSAVVRTGGQFALGGQRSALTLDVGALAGAAGTSLTINPGFVVGGTVGLTLRPRAWYGFGIGASADLVTGRYTGVGASVGISFSPLGEMQIGE